VRLTVKGGSFQEILATNAMATRTIELDRNDLDKSLEVLSSAKTLQLTRFERISYRALMVSVDLAVACFIAFNAIIVAAGVNITAIRELQPIAVIPLLILYILYACAIVGLLSLVLNIRLFLRAFRERARLKKLGLSSLSKTLWKESRRSRWISRIHAAVLMIIVIWIFVNFLSGIFLFSRGDLSAAELISTAIQVIIAATLFAGTRYLQIQRERLELTANAEELRKAFQNLRQRAGKTEVVSVPTELVEQTAKIESAQIAKERKDAILESVRSRPTGYAIAFDHDAIEQRAMLDVADRIELADFVAQLSIAGMKLEPREGVQRDKTQNNRVEIDYVIDSASHSIRVTAVRRVREVSDASVSGASHA